MTRQPNFNKKNDSDQISDSTKVIRLVVEDLKAHFFRNPDGDTFAVCEGRQGTREVYRTDSRDFSRWIAWRYYIIHQRALPKQTLLDAIGVLEGRAAFLSPVEKTFRRVAGLSDKVYIDLCDDRWRVIAVDATGWQILDKSPINFTRSRAMLPLPEPQQGSLDYLRDLLNVTDHGWKLTKGLLLGSLNPNGPYPVAVVSGEQGSAKSTYCEFIRNLIDPNSAPLRSVPRSVEELYIAAANSHFTCLDNVSKVSHPVSDALCRIATGAGTSTRKLYSDSDEHILHLCKPSILNGIGDLLNNSDLIDRAIFIECQPIPEKNRLPRQKVQRLFEAAWPHILGGLLDAVSQAIRERENVKDRNWPRMADFAIWVTAGESALNLQPGEFLNLYEANRAAANSLAIENSEAITALVEMIKERTEWTGTASELLEELNESTDKFRQGKYWPNGPRALANLLRRVAPNLRRLGIDTDFPPRTARARRLMLKYRKVASQASSSPPDDFCDASDASDRHSEALATEGVTQ